MSRRNNNEEVEIGYHKKQGSLKSNEYDDPITIKKLIKDWLDKDYPDLIYDLDLDGDTITITLYSSDDYDVESLKNEIEESINKSMSYDEVIIFVELADEQVDEEIDLEDAEELEGVF